MCCSLWWLPWSQFGWLLRLFTCCCARRPVSYTHLDVYKRQAKDPVNMAGFVIGNLLDGTVKQYHWQDVPALQKRSDVVLLDTRTTEEYSRGHIEGTRNIPLDELRERLGELDKSKTIYVNCQSGLRSYIACRILMQNGFDCYNFSGGYRFYEIVAKDGAFDETPAHGCGIKI